MKNLKLQSLALGLLLIATMIFVAADHIEAPAARANPSADITDFYAFQGSDTETIAFVVSVNGLLDPAATANATFSEDVLFEINIDNDGDNVEDLVIQAIPRDGQMFVFGPTAPTSTGLQSTVATSVDPISVDITGATESAITEEEDGITIFAGPRDDPFFMDFTRFNEIVGGLESSFEDPGTDTFAGTNVMSVIIEVPKDLLGGMDSVNTWVETKVR